MTTAPDIEERTDDVATVEFFFDPGCPWTWKTSRWLIVAGVDITWRSFRLEYLSDEPVPEQWAQGAEASKLATRLVEHLAREGRNDDIAEFYREYGQRVHDELEPATVDVVHAVTDTIFGTDDVAALNDVALDEATRRSFDEAQRLVGEDLGSPVLALTLHDGRRRAVFGPIITQSTDPTTAAEIFRGVATLIRHDQVAELKRARDLHGELDRSLTPHVD